MLSDQERNELQSAITGVQRIAAAHLQNPRSPHTAIAFIANLHRGVDQLFQGALDAGVKIACKTGCNACCSVRVHATEPEIFQIANTLNQGPAAQREAVLIRLNDHAELASQLSISTHRTPCPFLDAGLCSVYSVRPAVCRKAHSLDVNPCLSTAADLPQSLNLLLKSEALMSGTAAAYHQAGLPVSSHELGQAVRLALNDTTLQARWLAGETVFQTCSQVT